MVISKLSDGSKSPCLPVRVDGTRRPSHLAGPSCRYYDTCQYGWAPKGTKHYIRSVPDEAPENLPNDGSAGIVRVAHVQPVSQTNSPSLEVHLIDEFPVFSRDAVRRHADDAL